MGEQQMIKFIQAALVAVPIAALAYGLTGTATADETYQIYMSPTGSDSASGSISAPVKTLSRVQTILKSTQPDAPVDVLIASGTYTNATQIGWNFYNGHQITFRPAVAGTSPVFAGANGKGYWISASLPAGSEGLDGNLRFEGLTVRDYSQGGIRINGGAGTVGSLRRGITDGLNGNVITGMTFKELGSKWAGAKGYGGVVLVNSKNNVIENTWFERLENNSSDASLIHGVYLADQSSGNQITGNTFKYVTGSPIRARNDSNDNVIDGNLFRRTGTSSGAGNGAFTDWFNDDSSPYECASHGNVFSGNDVGNSYNGSSLPFTRVWPGTTKSGCSLDGAKQVVSSGNI